MKQDLRRKAFTGLTRPHLDALYRTSARFLGGPQGADDLVQETCLKAFRAFDRFEEGTNYRAWLFRIMKNTYIDRYVRKNEPVTVDWDSLPGALQAQREDAAETSPEILYLHKSFCRDTLEAMAGLPPEVRLVVSLILVEGFSYNEVAAIAGCPIGTVRSRLFRGRRHLQKALKDYLPPAGSKGAAGSPLEIGE